MFTHTYTIAETDIFTVHTWVWKGDSHRMRESESETEAERTQWDAQEMHATLLSQSISHTEKEEQAEPQASSQALRWTMWDQAPPAASSSFQHSVTCQSSTNTHTNSQLSESHISTSSQGISKCTLRTLSPLPLSLYSSLRPQMPLLTRRKEKSPFPILFLTKLQDLPLL